MASGLFSELRRRNVLRVAAAYLAIAWLALQIVDTLSGFIPVPEWLGLYLLAGLVIGFPIAVFLAWAYELTPEGVRAAADAPEVEGSLRFGGRKVDFVIIGALLMVIVLLLLANRIAPPVSDSRSVPTVSSYTQLTRSRFVVPPMPSPYPIVPDTSRIYFNDFDLGQLGVRQVSQQGGEAVRLDTSGAEPDALFHPLAMTPDDAGLAMNRVGPGAPFPFELWLFPLVGGTPRLVGQAGDATFSPDGTLLAYESKFGAISMANADLSDPRELVKLPGRAHWIRFSPDGQRLRFTLLQMGPTPPNFFPHVSIRPAIWEVGIDGGEAVPLLPDWGQVEHCCGVWTPDGEYFVFQAVHDDRTQLWALHESAGGAPVQITSSALDFRRPAISPDGKKIFAISWQLRGEVARYDHRVEALVPMPGFESTSADQLSFSADGERVAYVAFPAGDLWASNRDGSGRKQLTFGPVSAAEPAWSPDGESIAYVGSDQDGAVGVYVIPANGGNARPIGDTSVARAFPGWTADSEGVVFMQAGKEHLQLFDVRTGESRDLPGTEGMSDPRLSPDGKMLAARFQEDRKKPVELIVMDLESGSRTIVTDDPRGQQWFHWGPDGGQLFRVDVYLRGNERTVWRFDLQSGETNAVAVIGNTPTAWSGVGMWVGIDPEGAPIVLKDTSIHHIYALDWLQ